MDEILTLGSPRVANILEARRAREEYARAWAELRRIGARTVDLPTSGAVPDISTLSDGAWGGQRCFIVGGGPSLRGFDFNRLRGDRVIAVNRAFESCPFADVMLAMDERLYDWILSGELGDEARARFERFAGVKLWLAPFGATRLLPGVTYVANRGMDGLTDSLSSGLYHGNNSGYAALNLAVALGADPIYLLGYDCVGDGDGGQAWYHDGYPERQSGNVYDNFAGHLERLAPLVRERGVMVVNLNPDSALRCFEFGHLDDVLPGHKDQITAITPTGDRPLAFGLLRRWVERQTRRPDQWIVVDDGAEPMEIGDWPEWATYLRREPGPDDPLHTLSPNLGRALPWITGDKIILLEDDEYYSPSYVKEMARRLDGAEIVGLCENRYYHLPTGGYCTHPNRTHASLAQTAFRASVLPEFGELLRADSDDFLDIRLWRLIEGSGRGALFVDRERPLYVGIKGLPGRKGIGIGHDGTRYVTYDKPGRAELRRLIGDDANLYLELLAGGLV